VTKLGGDQDIVVPANPQSEPLLQQQWSAPVQQPVLHPRKPMSGKTMTLIIGLAILWPLTCLGTAGYFVYTNAGLVRTDLSATITYCSVEPPRAGVRLVNEFNRAMSFTITVSFMSADGERIATGTKRIVKLDPGQDARIIVVGGPSAASGATECKITNIVPSSPPAS
jgi:hypothetical protein